MRHEDSKRTTVASKQTRESLTFEFIGRRACSYEDRVFGQGYEKFVETHLD